MKSINPSGAAPYALRRGRGRGALTVLALALCMGCMLAMETIGAGGEAQFAQAAAYGDPLEIVVTPGGGNTALGDAEIESFKQIAGVQSATGVIKMPLQISIGGFKAENLEVTAVDPKALRGRLAFQTGGLFQAQYVSPQIVLGYSAQMQFTGVHASWQAPAPPQNNAAPTPPPLDLGQGAQISFAPQQDGNAEGFGGTDTQSRTYSGGIAGILRQDKSGRNGQAFMSLAAARKMLGENYGEAQALGLSPNSYTQAYVFAESLGSVRAVEDALAAMGYPAQSDVNDLDGLLQVQSLQRSLLTVIEVFSAATAVLLLLCILLAGRRRERSAGESSRAGGGALLGYAALGLIGGLAAAGLSGLFALIVNTSSAETVIFGLRFGQNSNLAIPFEMALETIGISIATALFAGWIARLIMPGGE